MELPRDEDSVKAVEKSVFFLSCNVDPRDLPQASCIHKHSLELLKESGTLPGTSDKSASDPHPAPLPEVCQVTHGSVMPHTCHQQKG